MDAIYARQSLDKKDSLSIESQIEQCQKHAASDVTVFQDKGFSGKNTNRPSFQQLIEAVEAGRIQRILVYRLDRFSRSIADFSQLWNMLEQHGVQFFSVSEQFDTSSPIGRAMLNIILVFAQLERETTAERVKDNYYHRFALGAWPGGPAPYGFNLTKITDHGRMVSSLVSNEKSKLVTKIFEDYINPGASLRSLAKALTAQGIPGPKREVWDSVSLSRLLHSPLYVTADHEIYWHYQALGIQIQQPIEAFDGIHACNVIGRRDRSKNKYNSLSGQQLTVANHHGFIPSELWLRVQDKLSKTPQIPRAKAGKHSWLTGLLKCARCGYAIKINHVKSENRFYLLCSGRSNLATCSASIHIDLHELEQHVATEIKSIFVSCSPEEVFPPTKDNAEDLLALDMKIERLVAAVAASSDVSAAYISNAIDKLHHKREALLNQTKIKKGISSVLDFDAATFEEKKIIAAQFIEKILLDRDCATIVWKF